MAATGVDDKDWAGIGEALYKIMKNHRVEKQHFAVKLEQLSLA